MGGIVGQADQYAVFDTAPRPERTAREAPAEIVREYTQGPRIGAGQLNPRGIRQASRIAVDTRGMDPREHAYAQETYGGPYDRGDDWVDLDEDSYRRPARDWDPNTGYQPNAADEAAAEAVADDDESGYNWGPVPHHEPGAEPGPHPDFRGDRPHPMGTPVYRPGGGYSDHPPSFSAARRCIADDGPGPGPMDQGGLGEFTGEGPDLFTPMYFRQRVPDSWAMMLGKTAGGMVFPHGFAQGYRVGLPYGNSVIRGVVTHLPDAAQVGVRWDDGQHSLESPGDIYRL